MSGVCSLSKMRDVKKEPNSISGRPAVFWDEIKCFGPADPKPGPDCSPRQSRLSREELISFNSVINSTNRESLPEVISGFKDLLGKIRSEDAIDIFLKLEGYISSPYIYSDEIKLAMVDIFSGLGEDTQLYLVNSKMESGFGYSSCKQDLYSALVSNLCHSLDSNKLTNLLEKMFDSRFFPFQVLAVSHLFLLPDSSLDEMVSLAPKALDIMFSTDKGCNPSAAMPLFKRADAETRKRVIANIFDLHNATGRNLSALCSFVDCVSELEENDRIMIIHAALKHVRLIVALSACDKLDLVPQEVRAELSKERREVLKSIFDPNATCTDAWNALTYQAAVLVLKLPLEVQKEFFESALNAFIRYLKSYNIKEGAFNAISSFPKEYHQRLFTVGLFQSSSSTNVASILENMPGVCEGKSHEEVLKLANIITKHFFENTHYDYCKEAFGLACTLPKEYWPAMMRSFFLSDYFFPDILVDLIKLIPALSLESDRKELFEMAFQRISNSIERTNDYVWAFEATLSMPNPYRKMFFEQAFSSRNFRFLLCAISYLADLPKEDQTQDLIELAQKSLKSHPHFDSIDLSLNPNRDIDIKKIVSYFSPELDDWFRSRCKVLLEHGHSPANMWMTVNILSAMKSDEGNPELWVKLAEQFKLLLRNDEYIFSKSILLVGSFPMVQRVELVCHALQYCGIKKQIPSLIEMTHSFPEEHFPAFAESALKSSFQELSNAGFELISRFDYGTRVKLNNLALLASDEGVAEKAWDSLPFFEMRDRLGMIVSAMGSEHMKIKMNALAYSISLPLEIMDELRGIVSAKQTSSTDEKANN